MSVQSWSTSLASHPHARCGLPPPAPPSAPCAPRTTAASRGSPPPTRAGSGRRRQRPRQRVRPRGTPRSTCSDKRHRARGWFQHRSLAPPRRNRSCARTAPPIARGASPSRAGPREPAPMPLGLHMRPARRRLRQHRAQSSRFALSSGPPSSAPPALQGSSQRAMSSSGGRLPRGGTGERRAPPCLRRSARRPRAPPHRGECRPRAMSPGRRPRTPRVCAAVRRPPTARARGGRSAARSSPWGRSAATAALLVCSNWTWSPKCHASTRRLSAALRHFLHQWWQVGWSLLPSCAPERRIAGSMVPNASPTQMPSRPRKQHAAQPTWNYHKLRPRQV
mmetsp:Transcript_104522/g.263065  ORF Transcript_104522/g.263065 Transcript_104522/m.263065 type:complete len:335 (+) Transcript_104522:144-1148(+)